MFKYLIIRLIKAYALLFKGKQTAPQPYFAYCLPLFVICRILMKEAKNKMSFFRFIAAFYPKAGAPAFVKKQVHRLRLWFSSGGLLQSVFRWQ